MKNQLLLAMVLVSVCLTKTLSHSIKNEATQKRTLSTKKRLQGDDNTNFILKPMTINIMQLPKSQQADFQVELGNVLDATQMSGSPYNLNNCFKSDYLKKHTETKPETGSNVHTSIIKDTANDLTKIVGSMQLSISAEVATVSGKAALNQANKADKSTVTAIVRGYLNKKQDILDIENVKEDDLDCNEGVKITHVVTKIVRGKMFSAEIKSSVKENNKDIKAKGELETKLTSMDIGGKAKIDVKITEFDEKYKFTAHILAFGGPFSGFIQSLKDFNESASEWFLAIEKEQTDTAVEKDEENKAISFTLTPIQRRKNFGNRVIEITQDQQRDISECRLVFNKMSILEKTMDYLLEITEDIQDMSTENEKLNEERFDLLDKKDKLSEAISNRECKTLLDLYYEISVTDYQGSLSYKTFSNKFKEVQNAIKNGKYYLSFDENFLTPNKALEIEFGSDEKDDSCHTNLRTHLTSKHRLALDKNRRLDKQPDHDKMLCKIQSTNRFFDDKLTEIISVQDRHDNLTSSKCQMVKYATYFTDEEIQQINIHNGETFDPRQIQIDNPTNKYYPMEGKPIIVQKYSWKQPDQKKPDTELLEKKIIDCKREWSVLPEYKDSDLPYFHILNEKKPIQTMKYNQFVEVKDEKVSGITKFTWEIEEVNKDKKSFSIKSLQKSDRFLCMYNYKDYNSLVTDNVPDVKSHEECQWFKKGGYLVNVKHNVCIIQSIKIAGTMRDPGTILLGGNKMNNIGECALYQEKLQKLSEK